MRRSRTAARIAALALGVGLLSTPAIALAGSHAPYVGPVKAGGTCTAKQAHDHATGSHDGDRYECRKTGPGCYLWKFDGHPTGDWTGGPAHCPKCHPHPSHSPTGSPTASPTPPGSPSETPSPTPSETPTATPTGGIDNTPDTTPAGDTVPDTLAVTPGPSAARIARYVGVGVAALALGVLLIVAARRRRTP